MKEVLGGRDSCTDKKEKKKVLYSAFVCVCVASSSPALSGRWQMSATARPQVALWWSASGSPESNLCTARRGVVRSPFLLFAWP